MASPASGTFNTVPRPPPLAIKPPAASSGPDTSSRQCSITSKNWVLPPLPKPGRKPATDTPPTKRKAQNRAAQRAFRERRAAIVGELEERLRQKDEQHALSLSKLQDQAASVLMQVHQLRDVNTWLEQRCQNLEGQLEIERKAKDALLKAKEESLLSTQLAQHPHAQQPPIPTTIPQLFASQQQPTAPPAQGRADDMLMADPAARMGIDTEMPEGCDNCSEERCKCIDDALKRPIPTAYGQSDPCRVVSGGNAPANDAAAGEQQRNVPQGEPQVKAEYSEMEIDFTEQFSTQKPHEQKQQQQNQQKRDEDISAPALFDTCGFCQDGTPCLCAEMAAENRRQRQQEREQAQQQKPLTLREIEGPEASELSSERSVASRMPTIQSLSHMTPPPSEGDAFSEPLPPISTLTGRSLNPCSNGPGTCDQCQRDPKSGVFCKSLAAARRQDKDSSSPAGGCCGGAGRAGGCCKDTRPDPTAALPLSLSCADTYSTLAQHPRFSRATDEMSSWIPKLTTLPNPENLANAGSAMRDRPAMEVEAASVMNVLRYFDRRFNS